MLGPGDFVPFFTALHKHEPFPWQSRLAAEVAARGWPDQIAAPTACGKTGTLDIAVFELARQATGTTLRTAPLRIFSIIDRHIVVDSAFQHARATARKLQTADGGVLRAVADALRSVSGEDTPLVVAQLRAGTWRDDSWVNSPIQPAVIVSTVDQVGSRLLFRGYGVGRGQRSLHAALVGTDSLLLVDEAHMSRPFVSTVQSVRSMAGTAEDRLFRPPTIVEMTATPQATNGRRFDLDTADYQHPVLRQRLTSRKVARLVRVPVEDDDTEAKNSSQLAAAAVREALLLARLAKATKKKQPLGPPAAVVAIVVNRVASAREIFAALSQRQDCDCLLLTGRVRPFDRDQLLANWMPKIRAGREVTLDRPLFVVATQCIEVGADLDFDGLVTEAAPLDALRQRFGRLDRLGRRGQSSAVILARSDMISPQAEDPVYGPAVAATWKWLQAVSGKDLQVDFGIAALPLPSVEDLPRLLASAQAAPRLRTQDFDAFACTSVQLACEPDLPLYLHGRRDNPDVSVVWRADLSEPLNAKNVRDAVNTVVLLPPSAPEAMPMPLYVARAWLRGLSRDISDVEGERRPPPEQQTQSRYAIRWRGDESDLITAADLRPGDVVVVPTCYGGCDAWGWNPDSTQPAVDIADQCARLTRCKHVFRLSRRQVPADALDDDQPQVISQVALDAALASLPNCPEPLKARRNRLPPVAYPAGRAWLIESSQRFAPPGEHEAAFEEAKSLLGCEIELQDHCRGVVELASRMTRHAELPDELVRAVATAAQFHDVGKVDPRFQTWLHCGDEIAATLRVLAKSVMNPHNRLLYEAAWQKSGLASGWCHELLSVRLAEQVCRDPLALHLIASHHGGGRPFHPPVLDPDPPDIEEMEHAGWRLALAAAQRTPDEVAALCDRIAFRFASLQRRYGWWGLASIESFLILADWRQSAAETTTLQDEELAQS